MNINEYLKQTATAITKENAKTIGAAIVPKYFKAGIRKDKRLKPMDRDILFTLHEFVNTETGHCYPSQQELADILDYSRTKVAEALGRLEKAGYIHRCPAKKPTKNGKFTETSDEIIITPFSKLNDNEYHSALIAEIARIKYVVAAYNKDSSARTIIATGENTESHTKQEMTEIRETSRRKAETEPIIIDIQKEKTEKMYKHISTKQEDEALEALRRQEAIERKKQPKQEQPQQPYNKATANEYTDAFEFIDEEIAELMEQSKHKQPKPQPKLKQEFDIDAWVNQPYQFTGRGA
ncbi:MAG: helix-turn-helix domain-containing protein [Sedimentibacter sp.]|uniref:helix-turn-helix domain-containing protein n=1 Tax=Sedimentibacter sp. TaxID=1960295 RepID=UPI003158F89E